MHKAPGVLVRDEILGKGFSIVRGPLTRTLHQERHAECPGHSQGSWVWLDFPSLQVLEKTEVSSLFPEETQVSEVVRSTFIRVDGEGCLKAMIEMTHTRNKRWQTHLLEGIDLQSAAEYQQLPSAPEAKEGTPAWGSSLESTSSRLPDSFESLWISHHLILSFCIH